jgi:succinate dehydrogenase/fumarate reductase-like Fe-S protein
MEQNKGVLRLFRFDPTVDTEARFDVFTNIPYEGRTVLDVLRYIYENFDSTFSFEWACTHGMCRCCVVSVNGKPTLACNRLAEKEMVIEPHPKFAILKDLIVNFGKPRLT